MTAAREAFYGELARHGNRLAKPFGLNSMQRDLERYRHALEHVRGTQGCNVQAGALPGACYRAGRTDEAKSAARRPCYVCYADKVLKGGT